MKHYVIIGGGITGLSLAWQLDKLKKNYRITVIEKNPHKGGMIETINSPFFFEKGPRTFAFSRSDALLELIYEAGLEKEILPSDPAANKRYIWNGKNLEIIPSFFDIVRAVAKDITSSRGVKQDESISSFFTRRIGKKLTQKLVDPFVLGIYAGDISQLSMQATFPELFAIEKQHRCLIKGFLSKKKKKQNKGLFTLKDGMKTLIETLAKDLSIIHTSNVSYIDNQLYVNNKKMLFDRIIFTGNFEQAQNLFPLLEEYPKLCYAPIISVNCGYEKQALSYKGFGYLVPSHFNEPFLGAVFDSVVFPMQGSLNQLRLTAMLAGAHFPDLIHHSDDEITSIVNKKLKEHLKLPAPDFIQINRYPKAIAQYPVGHTSFINNYLERAKKNYPNVDFLGSYIEKPAVNGRIQAVKHYLNRLK